MSSQKGKNKIVSLAMEPEIQAVLKKQAESRGVSSSAIVRELIQKYIMTDENTTKVVLSIPKQHLSNVESLRSWLTAKCQALVQHFSNGSH